MFDPGTESPVIGVSDPQHEVRKSNPVKCGNRVDVQAPNEQWVRERFAEDRAMSADYLRAMVTYPWLCRSIELPSLVGHVEGVVAHFKDDGLDRELYFSAVAAYPPLALQKSSVVIDNVEQVLAHYRGDGLSRRDYLHAAIDQPILFRMPPQAVIDNITDLEEWLAGAVTGAADCLRKAVDRPRLFSRGPDALPSLSIAPISDAAASPSATAGGMVVGLPNPDGPAAPVEGLPTTRISDPVIHQLTRAVRTRSQAA
jgi:hypothetical protein